MEKNETVLFEEYKGREVTVVASNGSCAMTIDGTFFFATENIIILKNGHKSFAEGFIMTYFDVAHFNWNHVLSVEFKKLD
jgi:hypothetical protein